MTNTPDRRSVVTGLGALSAGLAIPFGPVEAQSVNTSADLILLNGRITTLDRQNPEADAVAIRDGRFVAVGPERDVMALSGPATRQVDLKGRRVIPGLIDSHMHII